jgi:hypothetical protein
MKIRDGFVSNSSSSSYTISKSELKPWQVALIRKHFEIANLMAGEMQTNEWDEYSFGYLNSYDAWTVTEDDDEIRVWTSMDNFNMYWYLTHIVGVSREDLHERDW